MEVILVQDVPTVGERGNIIKVKNGYARNFLIPKGLAAPTGTGKAKHLAHQKKLVEDRRRREMKESERLAERLSSLELEIPVMVGEEDKLFGSVTTRDISEALSKKGFEVDRRKIELEDPIHALGVYTVQIRMGHEIVAKPKVWVVKAVHSEV